MPSNNVHNQTLLDLLADAGDHPALVAPSRPTLTYSQVRANVTALAAQLNDLGLGRGDRIAIVMPNGPEVILAFFAAALCGTAAPLNPKYKQDEFAFYYEDTRAQALITLSDDAELAHAAAPPEMMIISATSNADGTLGFELLRGARHACPHELAQPNDVAMILHTSGTTSRPKRVPIRHRNLVASASNIVGTAEYQVGRYASIQLQNSRALKPSGQTTVPPEASDESIEATMPWMWNSGMTHSATSSAPRPYVPMILSAEAARLRWRIGTRLGRLVVPLVCRIMAMSSGCAVSTGRAGRAPRTASNASAPSAPGAALMIAMSGVAAAWASSASPGRVISALACVSS